MHPKRGADEVFICDQLSVALKLKYKDLYWKLLGFVDLGTAYIICCFYKTTFSSCLTRCKTNCAARVSLSSFSLLYLSLWIFTCNRFLLHTMLEWCNIQSSTTPVALDKMLSWRVGCLHLSRIDYRYYSHCMKNATPKYSTQHFFSPRKCNRR